MRKDREKERERERERESKKKGMWLGSVRQGICGALGT